MKHVLAIGIIAGLLWIICFQNSTIMQQQRLVREMVKNPYCLIPEGVK